MKKTLVSLILIALLLFLTACSESEAKTKKGAEMERWLSTANLDAEETPEELYKKALAEDTLVVYSISSRVMDVKKSFEKQYPGLTVYVNDLRSADERALLEKNFENADYECDVVICDNNDGYISEELVSRGIVYKYIPYDIKDKIEPENDQEILSLVVEIMQLFYNDETYDAPPLDNWWELTEEKFRGKVVMINPLKSSSTQGFIGMTIKNSDLMKQAYYDRYGRDILLEAGENAGQAFWRMLLNNDLILLNSADAVMELVGATGQPDPPVGIMISSKMRMKEIGYQIEPIFSMDAFAGMTAPTGIVMAGGCKNINSAKLFIRWILGETDGQGEGYKPYLQNGTWSARSDVQSTTKISTKEITLMKNDPGYLYENRDEINRFWNKLLEEKQND